MEDLASSCDPVVEGVTFYVKYLGSCIVDKASGEDTTAEAVKTIVTMVRKVKDKISHLYNKNFRLKKWTENCTVLP